MGNHRNKKLPLCDFSQNGVFGPSLAQALLLCFGSEISYILEGLMQNYSIRMKFCGLSGSLLNSCQSHPWKLLSLSSFRWGKLN